MVRGNTRTTRHVQLVQSCSSVFLSYLFGMQITTFLCGIFNCSMSDSTILFYIVSRKVRFSRGNILNTIYVFQSSLQVLSGTLVILRKIRQIVLITNAMNNSYNRFLFHSFLCALHVSNESSRSPSGARHNILYYTV